MRERAADRVSKNCHLSFSALLLLATDENDALERTQSLEAEPPGFESSCHHLRL
jgi:hypothetical protein